MGQLRAVLIENCKSLEKALYYAYDVGKKVLGVEVEAVYHAETPFGHVFVVGEKGLAGKREKTSV